MLQQTLQLLPGLWVRGLINIFLLLPVGICWHTQEIAQLVQVVINCFFKVFLGLCERQTAAKTYKLEHGVEVPPPPATYKIKMFVGS